jgi:hypothetical protein
MNIYDYDKHIDPEYPHNIVIPGKNFEMMMVGSPTNTWLRTKKYPYIVGGNIERHTFRFKEHKHATEFALRWA